jgi:hypothetical protein
MTNESKNPPSPKPPPDTRGYPPPPVPNPPPPINPNTTKGFPPPPIPR